MAHKNGSSIPSCSGSIPSSSSPWRRRQPLPETRDGSSSPSQESEVVDSEQIISRGSIERATSVSGSQSNESTPPNHTRYSPFSASTSTVRSSPFSASTSAIRYSPFSASTPEIEFRKSIEKYVKDICLKAKNFTLEPLFADIPLSLETKKLLHSTSSGLERGFLTRLTSQGCSGAYYMHDSFGQKVAVFKPRDEEPMAVNNPRGKAVAPDHKCLRRGVKAGDGAIREVAAYILDHPRRINDENGFAGVPQTMMVKCCQKGFDSLESLANEKIGSLQRYVNNKGSSDEFGYGSFPRQEVHKISVLDIRLANGDRHTGNILVATDDNGENKLIPIDHGYCLPDNAIFEDCRFEWIDWPQVKHPYSTDIVEFIRSLDAEKDITLLKENGCIIPNCALTLKVSTMLLKKGVERGLTPYQIGSMMIRKDSNPEEKSTMTEETAPIKRVIEGAQEGESDEFMERVSILMDREIDREILNICTAENLCNRMLYCPCMIQQSMAAGLSGTSI